MKRASVAEGLDLYLPVSTTRPRTRSKPPCARRSSTVAFR